MSNMTNLLLLDSLLQEVTTGAMNVGAGDAFLRIQHFGIQNPFYEGIFIKVSLEFRL